MEDVKYMLEFHTGARNLYVFDTAQQAMDAFDEFAATFVLNEGKPYKDTMCWKQYGGGWRGCQGVYLGS